MTFCCYCCPQRLTLGKQQWKTHFVTQPSCLLSVYSRCGLTGSFCSCALCFACSSWPNLTAVSVEKLMSRSFSRTLGERSTVWFSRATSAGNGLTYGTGVRAIHIRPQVFTPAGTTRLLIVHLELQCSRYWSFQTSEGAQPPQKDPVAFRTVLIPLLKEATLVPST